MIIKHFLNLYLVVFGRNSLKKMNQPLNRNIVSLCNKFFKMEERFSLKKKLIFLLLKQKVNFLILKRENKKLCQILMKKKKLIKIQSMREREWVKKMKINSNQKLLIYLEKYFNHIKINLQVYLNIYLKIILLLVQQVIN